MLTTNNDRSYNYWAVSNELPIYCKLNVTFGLCDTAHEIVDYLLSPSVFIMIAVGVIPRIVKPAAAD